jgi:hypothetical protein
MCFLIRPTLGAVWRGCTVAHALLFGMRSVYLVAVWFDTRALVGMALCNTGSSPTGPQRKWSSTIALPAAPTPGSILVTATDDTGT